MKKVCSHKGKKMQTIKIEIEDSLYENLVAKGIDIQSKIKEFIYETIDDGYPAISFEEAKQRVADAVERYKTGKGTYYTEEEYYNTPRIKTKKFLLKCKD